MSRRKSANTVGALDIGTNKIACLIFDVPEPRNATQPLPRVIGLGHQRSHGIKSGVVVGAEEAENAIRQAVAQAERTAGVTLPEVYVAITCGRLASSTFTAHADINRTVTNADIARLFEGAHAYVNRDGRTLVHMNRKAFLLDGAPAGDDPRRMQATRLSAQLHAVTADRGAVANLVQVVERCHLKAAGLVAAPYASALSVTSEDERQFGVTVIDMGGGTTSWAIFKEGQFVECAVLATGGHHLTFDIAQNLRCSLAEAERIKALYASMVNAKSDLSDRFCYDATGAPDGEQQQMSKAGLCDVVRPRVEALLQVIADKHHAAGRTGGHVVLTGGASQLMGLTACASYYFDGPVRLGRPQALPGTAAGADNPAFAASAGLAAAVAGSRSDVFDGSTLEPAGYLSRLSRWIGNSF